MLARSFEFKRHAALNLRGAAEFKQSRGGSSSALALGKICAIEFKQGESGSE